MQQVAELGLVWGVRRWDVVGIMINGIVGAGIFGLPSKIFALTGTYSLLAFAACALFVALVALCCAEVASRFSDTGGPYLYAYEAFGSRIGFTVGWLALLSRLSAFAFICNVLASYLSFFWAPADSGLSRALIITGVTMALTILNVMGVGKAAVACDFFTVAKLVPLLVFVVIGLVFLDSSSYSFSMWPDIRSFSLAVSLLFFAFTGFESAFITAGESRDPRHDFTFALPVALAVVAVIYILVQGVCIGTLPGLATSVKPLADASSRFIGITGGAIITAGMLISAAGTLSGTLLAGPRLFFAMAEHGQFPRALAKTHRRFHTPHIAILLMASAGLVLALSGTFTYLLTLATISKLATFLATCAALPVLRRQSSRPVSFHLRGGIFLSIVTSAICIWLLANSGLRELRDVGIAAIAGLAFQLIWNLSQRRVNSSLASEGSTPEAGQS